MAPIMRQYLWSREMWSLGSVGFALDLANLFIIVYTLYGRSRESQTKQESAAGWTFPFSLVILQTSLWKPKYRKLVTAMDYTLLKANPKPSTLTVSQEAAQLQKSAVLDPQKIRVLSTFPGFGPYSLLLLHAKDSTGAFRGSGPTPRSMWRSRDCTCSGMGVTDCCHET